MDLIEPNKFDKLQTAIEGVTTNYYPEMFVVDREPFGEPMVDCIKISDGVTVLILGADGMGIIFPTNLDEYDDGEGPLIPIVNKPFVLATNDEQSLASLLAGFFRITNPEQNILQLN